jgi:hypothetical protein
MKCAFIFDFYCIDLCIFILLLHFQKSVSLFHNDFFSPISSTVSKYFLEIRNKLNFDSSLEFSCWNRVSRLVNIDH